VHVKFEAAIRPALTRGLMVRLVRDERKTSRVSRSQHGRHARLMACGGAIPATDLRIGPLGHLAMHGTAIWTER
jgi:hypothetical protein